MIPITEFKGRDVAVFGLARTGLAYGAMPAAFAATAPVQRALGLA